MNAALLNELSSVECGAVESVLGYGIVSLNRYQESNMMTYGFENLEVWQNARVLSKRIYQLTSTFPKSETFGLSNQMRRAAVSVCSNIAEGSSRTSLKDQANFYQIAYSSLMEVLCQMIVSLDLSFLSHEEYMECRTGIDKISRQLSKLRSSALSRINK